MKTHTIYTRLPLPADRRDAAPGDTALVLTESVIDRDGNELAVGTVVEPLSAGYDNVAGEHYRTVNVASRPSD